MNNDSCFYITIFAEDMHNVQKKTLQDFAFWYFTCQKTECFQCLIISRPLEKHHPKVHYTSGKTYRDKGKNPFVILTSIGFSLE